MGINELSTQVFANVNVAIVVTLMALGFAIKHFKFLEKFQNEFIPPFLLLVSVILTFIDQGLSVESTMTAIVSAAVAIGLHQQGKNIFSVSIVPTIMNMFGSTTKDENE